MDANGEAVGFAKQGLDVKQGPYVVALCWLFFKLPSEGPFFLVYVSCPISFVVEFKYSFLYFSFTILFDSYCIQ